MTKKGLTYILFIISLIVLTNSCRQSKYVADGDYLYVTKEKSLPWNNHKKTIHFIDYKSDSTITYSGSNDLVYAGDLYSIIKPQPNRKISLYFYNAIDSVKMNRQMLKKKTKIDDKNQIRQNKENRINKARNDEAKTKGKDSFYQKKVSKKRMKSGWRYWIVNKIGEEPVLADTALVHKSTKQVEIYLRKKGFYDSKVKDTTLYFEKSKKSYSRYSIYTGKPYVIRSIGMDTVGLAKKFNADYLDFLKKKGFNIHPGDLFDSDKIDAERERFSKFLKDNAFFDFNKNYIYFMADTTKADHLVDIYIRVKPKYIDNPNGGGEKVKINHMSYKVNKVTYYLHNKDSLSFKDFGAYKVKLKTLGLEYGLNNYPLLDTLLVIDTIYFKKHNHGVQYACNLNNVTDSFEISRGVFIYNEKLPVSPYLLDRQNFLEIFVPNYKGSDNGWYKEYYVERSYRRLLGLDIFANITPSVIIDPSNPKGRYVQVTYHLTPGKKQLFTIEPRATNSNGYLGVSASISYLNKNIFGGAEKLKMSFSGGLESQPAVFDKDGGGELVSGRQLNTYEISPKISLEFPKLVPLPACIQKTLSKRNYPSTILDMNYNYQSRNDFDRHITELSYAWKFNEGKTNIHKIKWQSINFVKLKKDPFFEQKLINLDDQFLINSYNDHFSNKFQYIFNLNTQRVQKEKGKKSYLFWTSTFTESGFILDKVGIGKDKLLGGLKTVFKIPFTEFLEFDNDFRYYLNLGRDKTLAMRFLGGIGYAFGNSPSLPYEQSFYAGGSNDLRAWTARTVAPGGTQTWGDTTSTNTQISDMKLQINLEYRFQFSSVLKAAWFIDAGNIWKLKDDPLSTKDDLAVFHASTFVKQLAIGGGFGLRLDFDFFIVRMDLAVPLHNPYMYEGERWIWQSRTLYDAEVADLPVWYTSSLSTPFRPRVNIGIGYPF